MSEAQTEQHPDLSSLDEDARLCVLTAKTQGARWEGSTLRDPVSRGHAAFDANGRLFSLPLPDYLHDPAAWGALMDRGLDGFRTARSNRRRQCWWPTREGLGTEYGPWASSLARAVVLAVPRSARGGPVVGERELSDD